MLEILNVRDNYALKQSAFNRLMQTNKKLASTIKKAKPTGSDSVRSFLMIMPA